MTPEQGQGNARLKEILKIPGSADKIVADPAGACFAGAEGVGD
jgi:hypothetical protein